ncbi:MAG: PaREP1 family protein [bacterium]
MNKRLALTEEFLKEGKIELKRYETTKKETALWQACEKGWATVAQALKAVNPKIRRHADFGKTAANLGEEYNNEEIIHKEASGETLHRSGFYENALDVIAVKHHLKSVEDFLKFIDNILSNGGIKKMKKIFSVVVLGLKFFNLKG